MEFIKDFGVAIVMLILAVFLIYALFFSKVNEDGFR
jgi:hypothetical protein